MRISSILGESWRNTTSGTSRWALMSVLLALVILLFGGADISQAADTTRQAQRFFDVGASTMIVSAPAHIDPRRCSRLQELEGVEASGALRTARPSRLTVIPLSNTPTVEATPSFADVIEVAPPASAGVYLSVRLEDALQLQPGDAVGMSGGMTAVLDTYADPDDGRLPIIQGSIIMPVPSDGPFDQCWLRLHPQADARGIAFVAADATTPNDVKIELSQYNPTLGSEAVSMESYGGRLSRFAPLAALIAGAALGWSSVWRRRLEFASALHAGVRRSDLALQSMTECGYWAATAVAISAPLLAFLVVQGNSQTDFPAFAHLGASTAICAVGGALVASTIAAAAMRESKYLDYFKDRA